MSATPSEHAETERRELPSRPYDVTAQRIFELRLRGGWTYALRAAPDGTISVTEYDGKGGFEPVALPVEFASAIVALALSSERDE